MKRLDYYWYSNNPVAVLLLPLSWLYALVVMLRRSLYRAGVLRTIKVGVPVIVVGNITVGGTGKTPLVIWLAEYLRAHGRKPGIVSRGYGGKATHYPLTVHADTDTELAGDEAVLLARRSACPVVVAPYRLDAARQLAASCDVLIADDGLQHYALARDIEIAVVDGMRRFGNNHCLPAGPLRERPARWETVDLRICNGGRARAGEHAMVLQPGDACSLTDKERRRTIASFAAETVHAVAAIGNPVRFFEQLRLSGLRVIEHAFPDHHRYTAQDFNFDDGRNVLMTEKDAVKCGQVAKPHYWYVPVTAELDPAFGARLSEFLEKRVYGSKAA
ncbi:MAG: tetraacyldisaccharide 4'-kinase [Gammaproteobacteria bacterium]|nr:tetraacyldisaccharide 4'-kinase [Gammaproteobacteria bacterium]